jgi:DNA polymerase I-like protein with 3'-5' exonuclease and polymerase domains
LIQQVMEDAYRLKIPLKTDARQGRNWGEMQTLG